MQVKWNERIQAVKKMPEQMRAASKLNVFSVLVALFAFVMAGLALVGVRNAH